MPFLDPLLDSQVESKTQLKHGGPYFADKFNFIFLFGGYSEMHKLGFKSH